MGRFLPPLYHVVFASLLHLLLLLVCRRLPYSFYFDRSLCGEGFDGLTEEEAALKQLANIASRNRELSKNVSREDEQLQLAQHGHSQLAVLVLTARRQGVSYLGRSLLALHREALAAARPPLVFVCTGEEAFQVKGLPFPFLKPNTSLPNPKDVNQKANRDFVFCARQLEIALWNNNAVKHILILEDDAVVMDGFFYILFAWMTFHKERLQSEPWLDLKLYLNPSLRGWAWELPILVELFAVTLLLTLVFHTILTRLQKTGSQSKHWLSFSFLYLSILIALLLLGRQHWIQWRRLHPQLYLRKDAPNHGTPAVLYPRRRLLGAAQFLEQNINTSTPFDLALGKYRTSLGITGHLLEPNLVRHVGAFSTFGEAYDHKFRGQRELEVKYQICA